MTELAIQVLGGAGYTKDHPVEQYCRDSKVFSIYEGTNHIQALDLVARKLLLDGGAPIRALVGDVKQFIKEHSAHHRFGSAIAILAEALDAVTRVATQFVAWAAAAQSGRILLVANQFSQALSEVCVGWLLLDAAIISERMLEKLPPSDPSCGFYRGKTSSAEYFVHWYVATVPAKMRVLSEAPAVALAMTEPEFGGDTSGE